LFYCVQYTYPNKLFNVVKSIQVKNVQGLSLVNNKTIVPTYNTYLTHSNNRLIQITTQLTICVSSVNSYIIHMVNRKELTILYLKMSNHCDTLILTYMYQSFYYIIIIGIKLYYTNNI